MTTEDLKTTIATLANSEWFDKVIGSFSFPYSKTDRTIQGVTAVYEFVNQQIEGWNSIGLEKIPPEFKDRIIPFLLKLKSDIEKFVVDNLNSDYEHGFISYWNNNIANRISSSSKQFFFTYDSPETAFLLKTYDDAPLYFDGAYKFIAQTNNYTPQNREQLIGYIIAYEFLLKDISLIPSRIDAERISITQIKDDFNKYLPQAEAQLNTHLRSANHNYQEYVKKIDDLKAAKETLFETWFHESNKEFEDFNRDAKLKIGDLEKTYKAKLKLEEPAKYWDERAKKLKK